MYIEMCLQACSTRGCPRPSWNGDAAVGCCRTCSNTGGAAHGPVCDEQNRQRLHMLTPVPDHACALLHACLHACPCRCLDTCLHTCLYIYQHMLAHMPASMPAHMPTRMSTQMTTRSKGQRLGAFSVHRADTCPYLADTCPCISSCQPSVDVSMHVSVHLSVHVYAHVFLHMPTTYLSA